MKASEQGAEGLERVASARSSGARPGNIQRALIEAFGWPKGAPQFSYIDIPMADSQKPQPHPFIFPHLFFKQLFYERREHWDEAVFCSQEAIDEFWSRSSQDPDIKDHPNLQSARARRRSVPLGMHGDGGSFSKQDSLLTISWNSLLGSGNTLRKRFVFTTIRKSQLRKDGSTLDAILRFLLALYYIRGTATLR